MERGRVREGVDLCRVEGEVLEMQVGRERRRERENVNKKGEGRGGWVGEG